MKKYQESPRTLWDEILGPFIAKHMGHCHQNLSQPMVIVIAFGMAKKRIYFLIIPASRSQQTAFYLVCSSKTNPQVMLV